MLFAASLMMLVIFSLGYPIGRWGAGLRLPSFESLAIMFSLGLLVGLALGLLTPSLHSLTWAWLVFILPCVWSLSRDSMRDGRGFWRHLDGPGCWIVFFLIFGTSLKVLSEPISGWDARSIWFFHAKVMFYADRVLGGGLWSDPSIAWSHVDYPKLNAFWAAAWMMPFREWNEYLPKFSLVLLAVPATLFCVGFSANLITRLLLITILILRMQGVLWTGYMDGLLATYAGLGVLYGIRFVLDGARADLLAILAVTGICCGLKNEGAVLAVLILVFVIAGRWLAERRVQREKTRRHPTLRSLLSPSVAIVATGSFLSFLIWSGWKRLAGISNVLAKTAGPLDRLGSRLSDGHSILDIWRGLFPFEEEAVLKLLAVTAAIYLMINWRAAGRHKWALLPAAGIAASYLVVLMLVYLATPFELGWHLTTSVDRTRMSLHACLAMGLIGVVVTNGAGATDPTPANLGTQLTNAVAEAK